MVDRVKVHWSRVGNLWQDVENARMSGRKFVVFPVEAALRLLMEAGWPRYEDDRVEFLTDKIDVEDFDGQGVS